MEAKLTWLIDCRGWGVFHCEWWDTIFLTSCIRKVSELSYSTCGLHSGRELSVGAPWSASPPFLWAPGETLHLLTSSVFGGIGTGDKGAALR